ncbi:hypothetical protein GGR56DRAFT_676087 [Xylariaceae sp. FL0804]|nr:hypothetical protein GGR56DRAFT_676087 [Xylariaceae sp. FL0804]
MPSPTGGRWRYPPLERHSEGQTHDEAPESSEWPSQILGMPDDEWEAREERRLRFMAETNLRRAEQRGETGVVEEEPTATASATVTQEETIAEPEPPTSTAQGEADRAEEATGAEEPWAERKPWESIVIGDLGENLSYIQEKDREIERQRFIVRYHEEHSPGQVAHQQRLLDELTRQRAAMEDNEENNLPESERERGNRIAERVAMLRRALATSRCAGEAVNIRAAIRGYETGEIAYDDRFTLLYAGHVVDRSCASYRSFSGADRPARLDRYCARHGPGWLWQEPPLALAAGSLAGGGDVQAVAMKGLRLDRDVAQDPFRVGAYPVYERFAVDRALVSRDTTAQERERDGKKAKKARGGGAVVSRPQQKSPPQPQQPPNKQDEGEVSVVLKTMLDCGATFPWISEQDLERMNVDLSRYSAQGLMRIATATETVEMRFYEMYVTVVSEDGEPIVGSGPQQATWPEERRELGGYYPVIVKKTQGPSTRWCDRLSGMMPFEACYMSSAPSGMRIWLGEDRRDVLGAQRMPAHQRFDSVKNFEIDLPREFESTRKRLKTPDRVMFVHNLEDGQGGVFADIDPVGVRGKSEMLSHSGGGWLFMRVRVRAVNA